MVTTPQYNVLPGAGLRLEKHELTIQPSTMRQLRTVPVTLVPSPGAGRAIKLVSIVWEKPAWAVATDRYSANPSSALLGVYYTDTTTDRIASIRSDTLTQTAAVYDILRPYSAASGGTTSHGARVMVPNAPIVMALTGATNQLSGGDNQPIYVTVNYHLVRLEG